MEVESGTGAAMLTCPACGTVAAPGILQCAGCRRFLHADRLSELARLAEDAEREGRLGDALASWREALRLLPRSAPQAEQVGERIEALLARPEARRDPSLARSGQPGAIQGLAWVGVVAVLIAGLTKLPALAGILGMFGVLWAVFGWKLGAGVLVSLYIHELGHVIAMWRRGLPISAPMFVPGLGAYVRMSERPATAVEDNRIGLAGPIAGLGIAAIAWGAGVLAGSPLLLAIAKLGALLNLFNLAPVWQLDGARGFSSLVRWQRVVVALTLLLGFAVTREGFIAILAIVAAVVAMTGRPARRPDPVGFANFIAVICLLCAIVRLAKPALG